MIPSKHKFPSYFLATPVGFCVGFLFIDSQVRTCLEREIAESRRESMRVDTAIQEYI